MSLKGILFYILMTTVFVFSSLAGEGSVRVLVGSTESGDSYTDEVIGFMNDAVSLELKLNGFTPVPAILDAGPEGKLPRKEASYMIFNQAVRSGDNLNASMTLYKTSDSTVLASVSEKLSMDFDLDRELSSALEPVLDALEEDIRITSDEPFLEEEEPEKKQSPAAQDNNRLRDGRKKWALSFGFGPFLSLGESGDYFSYGLMPELHGEYRISIDNGYLGLGLASSVNITKAEGILFDADLLLASLGPEFRMGYFVNRSLEFFFKLSGGGTYMLLDRAGTSSNYAIFPYAGAGLGFSLELFPMMAFYLSSSYMMYFEESLMISGFYPSAGFSVKF